METQFAVPDNRRSLMQSFLALPADTRERVVGFFLGSSSDYDDFFPESEIEQDELFEICEMLVELAVFADFMGEEACLEALALDASRLVGVELEAKEIFDVFSRVATSQGLELSKRATRASWSYQAVAKSTSVFTDIRPVFTDKAMDLEMLGFLVKHHLRISYTSNGKPVEMYVAFDTEQLYTLSKAIDRAIEKTEIIGESIQTDVPWINMVGDSEK